MQARKRRSACASTPAKKPRVDAQFSTSKASRWRRCASELIMARRSPSTLRQAGVVEQQPPQILARLPSISFSTGGGCLHGRSRWPPNCRCRPHRRRYRPGGRDCRRATILPATNTGRPITQSGDGCRPRYRTFSRNTSSGSMASLKSRRMARMASRRRRNGSTSAWLTVPRASAKKQENRGLAKIGERAVRVIPAICARCDPAGSVPAPT